MKKKIKTLTWFYNKIGVDIWQIYQCDTIYEITTGE